jgi:hypothetical protein
MAEQLDDDATVVVLSPQSALLRAANCTAPARAPSMVKLDAICRRHRSAVRVGGAWRDPRRLAEV